MSDKNIDIVTKALGERIESLVKDAFDSKGGSMGDLMREIGQAILETSPKTVYRWRKGNVEDRYYSHIAKYFGVNEDWLRTGEGEKYADSHHVNTSQGVYLHEVGNNSVTSESETGDEFTDKIDSLKKLVYSLIPMNEMKDAIFVRGVNEKTPFRFIFERDFEGDSYEIEFIARVRRVNPSPPKEKPPAKKD